MCHAWRVLVAALGDHTFSQQLRGQLWDNMLESCAVSVLHMLYPVQAAVDFASTNRFLSAAAWVGQLCLC